MRFLLLFTILSVQLFSSIEYFCYEDFINQNCTSKINVDISGFDSDKGVLSANWYYKYSMNGKLSFQAWDDEVWETNEQKYIGFSAIDNLFYDDGTSSYLSGLNSGIAFFQDMDVKYSENTATKISLTASIILQIYSFVGDTQLIFSKTGSDIFISKNIEHLSSIQFGNSSQRCIFAQTGEQSTDSSLTYSLNFSKCPVTINAVDADTNIKYQYTSTFDNLSHSFTLESQNEDFGDKGEVERELFNLNGEQVGYLIFDFFTNKFKVLDLNKEPFKSE